MTVGNHLRTALSRLRTMRWLHVTGVLVVAGLVVAVPEVRLARATRKAVECLSQYTAPRGPETPSCGHTVEPFIFPAKVPWTAHRARYRAEELGVRMAHDDYIDAAVGRPDKQALSIAAEAIEHQATVVQNGSTRVTFNELGPSIGAPDPGRDADELGDRTTLIDHGENWFNWRVRMSTLRAALLSGDVPKAQSLAKRYAVDDPRDPDIRSAVGALLCMAGDTQRALEFLVFIQDDRASRRYEALGRDYGDVRALVVACAIKAGLKPPKAPPKSDAGSADAIEQRALQRLRLSTSAVAESSKSGAIAAAMNLLDGGPRNPGSRAALLASVLALGADVYARDVVRLSKPRFDESAFAPPLTQTAMEWLAERRALGDHDHPPITTAATFVSAAKAVDALVTKAKADEPKRNPRGEVDTTPAAASLVPELERIEGAFYLEGAAAFAREGNASEGLAAVEEATRLLGLDKHARNLLRSNIFLLTGDYMNAMVELDRDVIDAKDSAPTNARVLAAEAVQYGELSMVLDKRDSVRRGAELAVKLATETNDGFVAARARWMLAAIGVLSTDLLDGTMLPFRNWFEPMGFGNPTNPWLAGDQDRQRKLTERALAPWMKLAHTDSKTRRAGRWAALGARGDVPPWLSVHLFLAGQSLSANEGDVEVWLNALMALDERRFSLRQLAFARGQAARMRGDASNAIEWERRYRTLRELASNPALLEMTRHLDI